MEILEPENFENGKPFKVTLTDEETDALVVAGFESLISESDLPLVVKKVSENIKIEKTHDLSEGELSFLVSAGLTKIIRDAIDRWDNES